MDDGSAQKERLEQELRFLKESFEAEVISKEEFEKGKDRVEKRLKELKSGQKAGEGKPGEEKKEPVKEKKEEAKTDESIVRQEDGKIKLEVIQDDPGHFEPAQHIPAEESEPIQEFREKDEKDSRFFKYAVVFVVLLLAVFFLYSAFRGNKLVSQKTEPAKPAEIQELKTNVLVLNDEKNCFNCGTQRVLGILESWFGDLNAREVDYNTDEGKSISQKFNAELLPLYILDENITKKQSFSQFKQVFVKKDNSYVLSENTAGSAFYLRRENIPNRLDLFIKPGDEASIKAEKNLAEFLDAFKEIKFERHLSSENLAKELDIKTFPSFLVNNRVKFAGVHTAETIKNNFCKLNKLPACEKILSKSLA